MSSVTVTLWRRLRADPLGFLGRALTKTLLGRLRYGRGDGYNAARYWRDRFQRHGLALRGPGHEGLSEEQNAEMYAIAASTLIGFCRANGIDLRGSNVLEVGCGNGFWAEVCRANGTVDYTGVDITDTLFAPLSARFPRYRFVRTDVTAEPLPGQYDVILMIDVVEHIVEEARLTRAMEHVRMALRPHGAFVIAFPLPSHDTGPRNLFYLRFWPESAILERFPGFRATVSVPFRNGRLLALMPAPSRDDSSEPGVSNSA